MQPDDQVRRYPALGFRPDIQALRGIAVLAVLVYHAGFGLPGGFVGVDAFFVLSGYLIATLLGEEAESTGGIRLAAFWGRRFRRLLPASLVVLGATAFWAWLTLPRLDVQPVMSSIRSAGLYVANFAFIAKSRNYLEPVDDPEPVLHFWSLSVEEQFYAVIPLIVFATIWLLLRRRPEPGSLPPTRVRPFLIGVFAMIAVASFGAMLVAMRTDPSFAFFSSSTRAWQFAMGAMLGLSALRLSGTSGVVVSLASLGAFAWACLTYRESTTYPGWAALVPTVGTLGLLWGGRALADRTPSRLVATLVHFGTVSYSLYLWHWFILVAVAEQTDDGPAIRGVGLLASWGLSVVTYRLVEDPARKTKWLRRRFATPAMVVVSLLLILIGTTSLFDAADEPPLAEAPDYAADEPRAEAPDSAADEPRAAPDYSEARRLRAPLYVGKNRGCNGGFDATKPVPCDFGSTAQDAFEIAVVGESHAGQWYSPLRAIAEQAHARLRYVTKSSCPLVDGITTIARSAQRSHWQCPTYIDSLSDNLDLLAGADLVIVSHASNYSYFADGEDPEIWLDSWKDREAWDEGLGTMLDRIAENTDGSLVFLGDTPRPPTDIPRCVSEPPFTGEQCDFDFPVRNTTMDLDVARDHGWNTINPVPWLCDDGRCSAIRDGQILYRDASHISELTARDLEPELADALDEWLPN